MVLKRILNNHELNRCIYHVTLSLLLSDNPQVDQCWSMGVDVVDHYLIGLCNHLSYVSMRSMIILLLCLDTNIIICEEATVALLD